MAGKLDGIENLCSGGFSALGAAAQPTISADQTDYPDGAKPMEHGGARGRFPPRAWMRGCGCPREGGEWDAETRRCPSLCPDSEPTQCTMLYSRQGTTETIEEVEAEQDEEVPEDTQSPQDPTQDGEVEAPPSYSKAVSLERLSFDSRDDSGGQTHMAVSPDDSRSDRLEASILPPLTHELTASELLLNK